MNVVEALIADELCRVNKGRFLVMSTGNDDGNGVLRTENVVVVRRWSDGKEVTSPAAIAIDE